MTKPQLEKSIITDWIYEINKPIFYEFIKTNEFESKKYTRYNLTNVEVGVNYILAKNLNSYFQNIGFLENKIVMGLMNHHYTFSFVYMLVVRYS